MPKIKSRQRMGYISLTIHWTLILCTCGLWYPIYASRRRARSTVTYMPTDTGNGNGPTIIINNQTAPYPGTQPYGQPQQPQQPPAPYGYQQPPQQWAPPQR